MPSAFWRVTCLLVNALDRTARLAPEQMPELIPTLRRLVDGEIVQLRGRSELDVSEATYERILCDKTASLFAGPRATGAARRRQRRRPRVACASFGERLGIAFQLVDDVLDYSGETIGQDPARRSARGQADAAARAGRRASRPELMRASPPHLRGRRRAGAVGQPRRRRDRRLRRGAPARPRVHAPWPRVAALGAAGPRPRPFGATSPRAGCRAAWLSSVERAFRLFGGCSGSTKVAPISRSSASTNLVLDLLERAREPLDVALIDEDARGHRRVRATDTVDQEQGARIDAVDHDLDAGNVGHVELASARSFAASRPARAARVLAVSSKVSRESDQAEARSRDPARVSAGRRRVAPAASPRSSRTRPR